MHYSKLLLKQPLLLLSLIITISCSREDIMVDDAGLSYYFIENQSSTTLFFGIGASAVEIPSSETVKIAQDGSIGVLAPLPSVGLGGMLKLYLDSNAAQTAYEQNPISNSLWLEEKQDEHEIGLVHYTLTVTDAMLQ